MTILNLISILILVAVICGVVLAIRATRRELESLDGLGEVYQDGDYDNDTPGDILGNLGDEESHANEDDAGGSASGDVNDGDADGSDAPCE